MPKSDIERLRPWINEPWLQNRVLEAARTLQQPFLLREVIRATDNLPRYVVQKRLDRLVKKGILTRSKALMSYPARGMRLQYLYRFAEPAE